VAHGQSNAITVLAASERGGLLNAPDTYLEKLCVGPIAAGHVDITHTPTDNVNAIATALGRRVGDITIVILERPRHEALIAEVRAAGARIKLISDGDLSAAVSCAVSGTGVHGVMGIGRRADGRGPALPRWRDPGTLPLPQRRGARTRRTHGHELG
jgi:fructose-1,6-bisphosphatase/sedoheptulose 1,7-bisphosphatase-like protein